MNNRKKFLLQSSLATTALLISKPFKTFANAMAPVTGYTVDNKIVFLHTANNKNAVDQKAAAQAISIKKNSGNVLLLHADKQADNQVAQLPYDASLHLHNSVLNSIGNYKIVYKGDIKIGIITANTGTGNVVAESNTLSSYLKKEKNCQVVVCLSQLGYKNNSGTDDIKLAEASANIDIIISGHSNNCSPFPVIAQNSKREEVIIHSAVENGFALGNIEIGFDKGQTKRSIAINNLLDRIN